jgi:hypothetical protein
MQTLMKENYDDAREKLQSSSAVLISSQASEIPKTQFGKAVAVSEHVNPKAKHLLSLGKEHYVELLGSTEVRHPQKSVVEKSILSDHVAEVMGVENQWGPPQLKPNWQAFNTNIDYVADPALQFTPGDLERARQDWLKPLLPLAREHGQRDIGRPLTMDETICGIDGIRFIDAVPMSTSMGFPVFGPKRNHFTETKNSDGTLKRTPSAEVMSEIQRLEMAWKANKRAYPVTMATLKDEPTKVSSTKVRVFQACAVAHGYWIRKYFLPVSRFLQLHPIQSESAVGVNAFSKDWQELMQHVEKYSQGSLLALDYSKYDVRMNSQVTTAVMNSFIDIAKAFGYSQEDLDFMRAMVADLVHPLIDFNGTLLMAYNMNTSGNNLTVNINSTAGSFYLRLGFFHAYPDKHDFRSWVSAMTYGDDMIGSVSKDARNFNFISYKRFLAQYGIKITLPNKSDDEVEFMEKEECDFLKRKSHYIPQIGCSIGQLDEMSIFKSLHCNLASKTTSPHEVALNCCDTALHEWFSYGKEHYEMRLQQLSEVVHRAGLPKTTAFKPFDTRVTEWKDKYTIETLS